MTQFSFGSQQKNPNIELTLTQLDFTVSLNACHDEIMNKMEVLTNMEIELLRKFEHQLTNTQMHYEMIHDVRVLILNLEETFKDVKQYFHQMGIQFVYDFFRKIQVLMVCGYNFLSQALLSSVDKYEVVKAKQPMGKDAFLECQNCKCTCGQGTKNKKKEIKEIQQYDYKISLLQNEEQKITSQIHMIYDKIMMQKAMIQKTKPSLAVRELQDMKQHIQNVLQSTNSVFEQTYMMKYVEFKNYLTQLKKPEDLVDYFIQNMSFNMKEKFLRAMQKAIFRVQHTDHSYERKNVVEAEVQTQKMKEVLPIIAQDRERQTSLAYKGFSSLKPQKNLLTKQRKYNQKMMAQIQYLRKKVNALMSESQSMKEQVQSKQNQRQNSEKNYETLLKLYQKKNFEFQTLQNQNKWLVSQKQNQAKRLRLQIKELRKDKLQTSNMQVQTFIPPNYVSVSTETEIFFFQNQIENEIINVLKKNNEKMIHKLNQKQRKLKDLKDCKESQQKYKQCKIICVGFLEDLREVTNYKMKEFEKQNQNQRKNEQKVSIREPIIPLNENTSNEAIIVTIEKVSQQIRKLLLTNSSKQKLTQERQSSNSKNKTFKQRKQTQKISDNMSDKSIGQVDDFFKNQKSRKSSLISLEKQSQTVKTKKSIYKRQHQLRGSQKSLPSQASQQALTSSKKLFRSRSSSQRKSVRKSEFQQNIIENNKRASFLRMDTSKLLLELQEMNVTKKIHQQMSIQTDVIKLQKNPNNKLRRNQTFVHFEENQQQTQLTLQGLNNLQLFWLTNKDKIEQLTKKDYLQSYGNRKHPYIKKPGFSKLKTEKSHGVSTQRDYLSINSTLPMTQSQISQLIRERVYKQNNQFAAVSNPSLFANQNISNEDKDHQHYSQSRLQNLMKPKSNRLSTSGLIVFKKNNQKYEKRTSQMVFDELKLNKNHKNQTDPKTSQFNLYRNDSLLKNTQSARRQSQFTQLSKVVIGSQDDNQNIVVLRNQQLQKPTKSKFIQRILEEQEGYSKNGSNYEPLIQVSKKTPHSREMISPRMSRQLPEIIFERTVKQMILSNQSKQNMVEKIKSIYDSLQKQKQNKKLKKIIKTTYTPRSSNRRKEEKARQTSKMFKLGEIMY